MIGQILGHFRITERLGSGGMGVVYRAFDEKLRRTVAIKVVGRDTGTPTVDRLRIIEEARSASGLNHPHICTVYETGDIDGHAFIAMEFVEGRPLSELIPVGGSSVETVIRYGVQVADALAHAHSRGVVHRDLKTSNVVVTPEGRAKVLDFGLARRIPADIATTVTQSSDAVAVAGLAGTLAYMAPEVLLGQTADERSDIWALGVLLFEMATGDLPFKGRNEFDLTASILRAPPQQLPTHIPPMVRTVIQRCLAKEAPQRYQYAGEVRAALEAIQSDVGTAPLVLPPAPAPMPIWSLKQKIATAAAVIAAIALTAWWYGRDTRSPWERIATGGRLALALASDRPAFDPSISADGKMLVYGVQDAGGSTDLFVRRVAGGGLVRLTNDDAQEGSPRFSPDGEWIAFTRRATSNADPQIRIVPALGGDVMSTIANAVFPVWSSDGKRLAFLRQTAAGGSELVIAGIDGSNARVLITSDSTYPFLREPAWSPDGDELAIVRGTGGVAGEIWLVPADGGEPRRMFEDPPEVFSDSPVYTFDGSGLVFSSNRGGATNIWFHPRRGGAPVRLTAGPGPDAAPSVALDGTISFINSRWRNTLDLHSLTGGTPRLLATHAPFMWAPSFSRDGREVAFSRGEVDGSWHIWTIPVQGGTPRRLTSTSGGEVYSRYTADDASILFHTWGRPRRVGRVRRDGGAPEFLSFGEASDAFPDMSPDGRWIAITRTDRDAERIYIGPATGGEARLLTNSSGSVPRWSPDGSRLTYGGNRGYGGGIFVVDADGRNERRLTETGGWPVWHPDGRQISFVAVGRNGDQEIHAVPVAGGPSRQLPNIKFNGLNHPFDISPDGAMLITSNSVHISDEIWLMEPRGR